MLSILGYDDPNAEVKGLLDFPAEDRPPVVVVHLAFQTMVGCGMTLLLVPLWGAWLAWKRGRIPDSRWFLLATVAVCPLGMVAIEAGWVVTEVGRQPWIIGHVLRTTDAVTSVRSLWVSLVGYTTLYLLLGMAVIVMLTMQFRASPSAEQMEEEERAYRS